MGRGFTGSWIGDSVVLMNIKEFKEYIEPQDTMTDLIGGTRDKFNASPGDGWWITPDGKITQSFFGEHSNIIQENPGMFDITQDELDTLEDPLEATLLAQIRGAIRAWTIGNDPVYALQLENVTSQAFRAMQDNVSQLNTKKVLVVFSGVENEDFKISSDTILQASSIDEVYQEVSENLIREKLRREVMGI